MKRRGPLSQAALKLFADMPRVGGGNLIFPAHTLESKMEVAYRRWGALEKHREMLRQWAKFIESPAAEGNIFERHLS